MTKLFLTKNSILVSSISFNSFFLPILGFDFSLPLKLPFPSLLKLHCV